MPLMHARWRVLRAVLPLLVLIMPVPQQSVRAHGPVADDDATRRRVAVVDFGLSTEFARAIAVQPDGRILLVGHIGDVNYDHYDILVMRHLPDGAVDPSFGKEGIVIDDFGKEEDAFAVALQPDGKIVVAARRWGYGPDENFEVDHAMLLVRYLPDGRLDPVFGDGGVVLNAFPSAAVTAALSIEPEGRIVVTDGFTLGRFLPDGSPDGTFGRSGRVVLAQHGWVTAVTIGRDRTIAVAGIAGIADGEPRRPFVARFNSNGTPDDHFGIAGVIAPHLGEAWELTALSQQTDGRLTVAGSIYSGAGNWDFAVLLLDVDGAVDASFGRGGIATTDFGEGDHASAVLVQPDGNIVVGGSAEHVMSFFFAVARYTSEGDPDPTFGGEGAVTTNLAAADQVAALALQSDGRILAAGGTRSIQWDFALVRYEPDGSVDGGFRAR